jgi:hypothetical protein
MNKKRPFSKLKKTIESLFDDKLKMEFCCNSYPIRGQWGHKNSIPRYYVKLGKEIIWDFPKDFDMEELPFYYWAYNNHINELVHDYIDAPIDKLLKKKFKYDKNTFIMQHLDLNQQDKLEIDYRLTEIFKAADRRIGKEKLLIWAKKVENPKVDKILGIRFNNQ